MDLYLVQHLRIRKERGELLPQEAQGQEARYFFMKLRKLQVVDFYSSLTIVLQNFIHTHRIKF